MQRYCASCGAPLAEGALVCGSCGKSAAQSGGASVGNAPPAAGSGGLAENVAGMLAYVTFIPAIIFLLLEPYSRNRFIRFHSFQCIFLSVALFVIHIVLMFIPIIGWLISLFVSLAALVLWIVLLIKAYQGQKFKVPFIGDLAEKQANA
jgi:uncharacterized membrane protein